MPICEICKEEFEKITDTHLKFKHNISYKSYIKKYPDTHTGNEITEEHRLTLIRSRRPQKGELNNFYGKKGDVT